VARKTCGDSTRTGIGIHFAGRKGFIKLALREGVPIIPAISHGAHDTLIVLADYYPVLRQLHEWGMPWLFGLDPIVFRFT
jgi:1-acyl-sn-glycerol-3-phosphate acyltransferase